MASAGIGGVGGGGGGGGGFEMQSMMFNNPNPNTPPIPSAPYPPPHYYHQQQQQQHNNNNNVLPQQLLMNNNNNNANTSFAFHQQFPNPNMAAPTAPPPKMPTFYVTAPPPPPPPAAAVTQRSPMASPPLDGARLMALLTAHSSAENPLPNALELPPPALAAGGGDEASSSVIPPPAMAPAIPTAPPVSMAATAAPPLVSRVSSMSSSSSKAPRGRALQGNHVSYDIDLRLPGEAQPQLEVSPIARYVSERVFSHGRGIAVNQRYICYGLRAGNIRILNIHTALKNILRGHTQRVTDMAFFSEDIDLLASVSSDGKLYVRKIIEDFGDDDKMQITEQILLSIQITGDWDSVNPRILWHCHQQDVLLIGIGKYVLKVDITKVSISAHGDRISLEDPCKFDVENLIEGVYCIGKHNRDVNAMSINHWIITRLATASEDGMVKIWDDNMMVASIGFEPHWGYPVSAVAFIANPCRPEHIVLLTADPFGRELKLWTSSGSDGWLTSPDLGKWQCIQTLELKSSEQVHENAFFNHVVPLPVANLILLANGKRNAMYAIHLDFGSKPSATCMDYLAEFSVAMPIISITATSDNVNDGNGTIQIFCVQTQAIQQYTLDLFQCLPPPVELSLQEKDNVISRAFEMPSCSSFVPIEASYNGNLNESTVGESRSMSPGPANVGETISNIIYPNLIKPNNEYSHAEGYLPVSGAFNATAPLSSEVPVPLSPRLGGRQPRPKSPTIMFDKNLPPISSASNQKYMMDRKVEDAFTALPKAHMETLGTIHKVEDIGMNDGGNKVTIRVSSPSNADIGNNCMVTSTPTHLVTPSQLMSLAVSSEKTVDPLQNQKEDNCGSAQEIQNLKHDTREETLIGLTKPTNLGAVKEVENILSISTIIDSTMTSQPPEQDENGREKPTIVNTVETRSKDEEAEERENSLNVPVEDIHSSTDTIGKFSESNAPIANLHSPFSGKVKKFKKYGAVSAPSSASGSPFTSLGSSDGDPSTSSGVLSTEAICAQFLSMHDSLNQLLTMHKDMQKQMPMMIAGPVAKEGKRMEASLVQRMEKAIKAQVDNLWTKFQEENAKRDKAERDRMQQLTSLLNSINKDLPTSLERVLKKEISSLAPTVARMVTPVLEKSITSAVNDAFQKGISEKSSSQLEKVVVSKLDNVVSRQIQTQFQSSGKQALQDALRSSFETSVIPAFERSCKAMFDQVDTTFRKGMTEHTAAVQQQFSSSHTTLASTLQEAVSSATSIAQSLKGELADGQRRLLTLLEGTGTSSARTHNIKQGTTGLSGLPEAIPLKRLEESLDPTKEISRLLAEQKYEEAFHKALQNLDVDLVSWLCSQVDPQTLFTMVPFPLSQGVLLSLVQQLSCDLGKDTARKLVWIREAALQLNPNDPRLACHMRPILGELYQNLHRQMLVTSTAAEASSIRLVLHVVNSILTACK